LLKRVHLKGIANEHLEPIWINGGNFFNHRGAARVFLNREDATGAFGQKPAREAAGTGADFENVAGAQIACLTGNLGR
jgi:hypothetical protein